MVRLWLISFWLPAALSMQSACEAGGENCPVEDDPAALLQRIQHTSLGETAANRVKRRATGDHDAIAGKSVYFLLVDRFGKPNATEGCENDNTWCGGTLKGITQQLDYIKDMGFDCIWITPVVKQFSGETPSGTGCMGYWAYDIYEIDPHFGTKQDLKDLVQGLHDRNMCIVYDFVGNHMGPIHSEEMVHQMVPFNETRYFNQLDRGNLTFNEYVNRTSDWPPPAQAMWSQSGAQCTKGLDCSCYVCDSLGAIPEPFGPCNGEMVYDIASPCPPDPLSPYCMPGDYACKGYSDEVTHRGWFYDLGDLNQSDPFVRKTQLDWIKWFVGEYDIDVLRLDTAPFMAFDFLSELQAAAGVPILGEVTTTNMTFHAQFQADPPPSGRPVLDGVLNFPLYYTALAGFCGKWFPFSTWNLTFLGDRMEEQLASPYTDLDTLGNFIDNHDTPRLAEVCKSDRSRMWNALAWTMLARGVPIVYYGTEVSMTAQRESFWQYGYNRSTSMFGFLKELNALRKEKAIGKEQLAVVSTPNASTLVFTRGGQNGVWVYVNNLVEASSPVQYCGAKPPAPKSGNAWTEAFSGKQPVFEGDCVVAPDTFPIVLVQRPGGPVTMLTG